VPDRARGAESQTQIASDPIDGLKTLIIELEEDRHEGLSLIVPGSRRGGSFPVQEAFPAKDRTPLGGLEGNRGFPPALRTGSHGFRFGKAPGRRTLALVLADLAALGLVLEILVVEEMLFSRRKYEIRSAIHALQDAVLKFRHIRWPRYPKFICRDGGESPATRRRLVRLFHFPA
jgi:hypothetical protein